ncbi:MAG: hypothetical protein KJ052_08700 [Candidatus Hydrogenedentes bacterium]|nr:hypothetical protein [Candidatus Hydrogenedentota bacterium]
MQTAETRILSKIEDAGRGSAFTSKDFLDLVSYEAAKKSLLRLANAGTLRRPLRGVYDYPEFSAVRNGPASPNPDEIARAIARAHGWTLIPSGETALNMLGLSTQVPAQWQYLSDGPTKRYEWQGGGIHLKHRANKDMRGLSSKTAIVVQALKALGEENTDDRVLNSLRSRLSPQDRARALYEARYVTTWVYEIIKRLAVEEKPSDA